MTTADISVMKGLNLILSVCISMFRMCDSISMQMSNNMTL